MTSFAPVPVLIREEADTISIGGTTTESLLVAVEMISIGEINHKAGN